MKALITGGRGFIGQHLYLALKKQGYDVILLKREYLLSVHEMTDIFKKAMPDLILHLASYGNHYNQL